MPSSRPFTLTEKQIKRNQAKVMGMKISERIVFETVNVVNFY